MIRLVRSSRHQKRQARRIVARSQQKPGLLQGRIEINAPDFQMCIVARKRAPGRKSERLPVLRVDCPGSGLDCSAAFKPRPLRRGVSSRAERCTTICGGNSNSLRALPAGKNAAIFSAGKDHAARRRRGPEANFSPLHRESRPKL